jgi:hypothetical protein
MKCSVSEFLICDKCKYKAYPKYTYPCAGCKHTNYYKYFTPLVNEFIGQCPLCGTPFDEGDVVVSRDANIGPYSVLKCTCHNDECRRISIYKIGTYIKKDK